MKAARKLKLIYYQLLWCLFHRCYLPMMSFCSPGSHHCWYNWPGWRRLNINTTSFSHGRVFKAVLVYLPLELTSAGTQRGDCEAVDLCSVLRWRCLCYKYLQGCMGQASVFFTPLSEGKWEKLAVDITKPLTEKWHHFYTRTWLIRQSKRVSNPSKLNKAWNK